jgi:alkylhydroperoxidase family enzyme
MARVPDHTPPEGIPDINVFRAIAGNEKVVKGISSLGGRLVMSGALPARARELVILNIAARRRCDYEWGHHDEIGRAVGLSEAEVADTRTGDTAGLTPGEAAAVRYALAVDGESVDDALWAATAEHYDDPGMVELTALAAFYGMLARVIAALEVEQDAGVAAVLS